MLDAILGLHDQREAHPSPLPLLGSSQDAKQHTSFGQLSLGCGIVALEGT